MGTEKIDQDTRRNGGMFEELMNDILETRKQIVETVKFQNEMMSILLKQQMRINELEGELERIGSST